MRLTRYTDYALRILLHAATDARGRTSIAEVSARHGISKNHVMKVVNQLANDGFLRTVRGRGGGFTLARPADEISLSAVVRATETELQAADCQTCMIRPGCGLTPLLGEAMQAFLTVLDGYSLADAAGRCDIAIFPLFALSGPAPA